MSEEATTAERELFAGIYGAFNARDIEQTLRAMHADVEWPNGMEGGYLYGHAAVRDYWTRQWGLLDPRVVPIRFAVDTAGWVVLDVHQVVRDLGGSVLVDQIVRHAYRIEAGLIRRMEIRPGPTDGPRPEEAAERARIRPATLDDAEALLSLARRFATSFQVDDQAFRASLVAVVSSESDHLIVAEQGQRVVGYLLASMRHAFWANGRIGWVEEVMVDEGSRRRGVGRLLMEAFEVEARAQGARVVALATRRAAPFYTSLGYAGSAQYFKKALDPTDRAT
jgi:GNAT superfamily N-acetyltransferase